MKRLSLAILMIVATTLSALAQTETTAEPEYKEYARSSVSRNYFDLCRTPSGLGIIMYTDAGELSETYPRKQLRVSGGSIYAGDRLVMDSAMLYVGDTALPLSKISSAQIIDVQDSICIRFSTRIDSGPDFSRVRRGNRIGGSRPITVAETDFVRGLIFTTTGAIDVYGEVNKDVISVYGDVHAGEGAKLRGDVVSLFGEVKVEPEASVYGLVLSSDDSRARRHRLTVREKNFEVYPRFVYNRVDGATVMLGGSFIDTDSTLPSLKLETGYAFASERFRGRMMVEQTVLHNPAITVGGAYGRWLATDDDHLLSDAQNTVFALIAREDFKDYYETTFGELFVRARPLPKLTGELAFRNDRSNWLDAHRHLWSVFGGDKTFRQNWSTVDSWWVVYGGPDPYMAGPNPLYRERGIQEIDTGSNSIIRFTVRYDTRNAEYTYDSSAWELEGQSEWSVPGLDSDWDYTRYTLSARRYQMVTRYTTLLLSGRFGNSDGYLPMYKRFFMGGLSTLHGYDHKEYMGTRYWLGSAEYRIGFRHSDIALSPLWEVGQIANDTRLGDAEVKHSLGAAVYLGDAFKITLARRLDRSEDANPKFYIRLQHGF